MPSQHEHAWKGRVKSLQDKLHPQRNVNNCRVDLEKLGLGHGMPGLLLAVLKTLWYDLFCMANRSHTVPAPLYGYLHRAHNTLLRFSRLGVLFLTDVGEGQAYVSARQCTFAMPMSPQCRYGGGYISRPWVRISVSTRCSIPGSVKQGAQGWHTGCHDDNILLNPYRVSICQTRIVKSMTYKPQRTSGTGLNTTEVSVCPSR